MLRHRDTDGSFKGVVSPSLLTVRNATVAKLEYAQCGAAATGGAKLAMSGCPLASNMTPVKMTWLSSNNLPARKAGRSALVRKF
jgi:hypothetical protein